MANSYKIIYVITETGGFGGTEVHTMLLIDGLIANGYQVRLISCNHSIYDELLQGAAYKGVTVRHVDISTDCYNEKALSCWKRELEGARQYQLIIVKGWNEMGSLPFLMLCRKCFKKVFFIEHVEPKPMPKNISGRYLKGLVKGLGMWWFLERYKRGRSAAYANRIIAVSNSIRQNLVKECSYPRRKVITVPNGIEWQNFNRNPSLGNEFRRQHSISGNALVFGMITRLAPEKGIDIALEALSRLVRGTKDKPAFLVIAGEGKERQKLDAITKKLNIENFVIFLGFVKRTQEVISAFDIILFPSRTEGLPLGLLEGMAGGCLPIVSDIGGMIEVVNGVDGAVVVRRENITELHDAMSYFSQLDRLNIEEKRTNVINRIKEFHNAKKSINQILEIVGASK